MGGVLVVLALPALAPAATIRAVGVLGNSGQAGARLIRVGEFPYDAARSGVTIDGDSTLWVSGGDRVNRVGLDGRLVESFPLEPKSATVDSRTFAMLHGTLYFLGRLPGSKTALFSLPMKTGAAARPAPVKLPQRRRRNLPWCLAPQPLDGRLLLATEPKDAEGTVVYALDPGKPSLEPLFRLDATHPHGLAADTERRVVYVGANFGLFVGGITHSQVYAITCVRPDGTPLSDAFPVPCLKTPATPTQFRGVLSLAGGALWDTAWYGFIARLGLDARGDPGRIAEWHHELHYPTQILGVPGVEPPRPVDPLLIATPMPDAVYFATWQRGERRLRLVRRIGALPVIASLGLSPDGWVTVGTARSQLWWRWEARADAAPHKAQLHIALTPLVFHNGRAFAIAAQYNLGNRRKRPLMPTIFSPRPGGRNEARRVGDSPPMKEPVGLAVAPQPGENAAPLFVSDPATRQIWAAELWLPNLRTTGKGWKPITIEGTELKAPTDLAALADGRLLLAEGGRLLMLEPAGETYKMAWELARWGDGPGERFGPRLRMAIDGPWLLVSDTVRHRVVWLDWRRRAVLGQLGHTDAAGADPSHLASPTLVALRGTRALVADAGNQRVLKLVVEP